MTNKGIWRTEVPHGVQRQSPGVGVWGKAHESWQHFLKIMHRYFVYWDLRQHLQHKEHFTFPGGGACPCLWAPMVTSDDWRSHGGKVFQEFESTVIDRFKPTIALKATCGICSKRTRNFWVPNVNYALDHEFPVINFLRCHRTGTQYVIQTPYGGVDPPDFRWHPPHLTQSRPPLAGYIIHKVA